MFCILGYLEQSVLNSSVKHFPFPILYRADESPEFVKLDRMGGILTYLLSEYETARNTTFKSTLESPISPLAAFHFALFNRAMILFNYAVLGEFNSAVRGFDKFVRLPSMILA
ncbi:MAG: hypothetical protein P4M11_08880 [Candidatus Pacebacteria bacterium]|nr:hypothetical protein [Candidatus Paceibacterota bacterium]